MWPFRKRLDAKKYKILSTSSGGYTFSFTDEEQQEIAEISKMFEGLAVLKDYQDVIGRVATAWALSNYTRTQVIRSQSTSSAVERAALIEKALVSALKTCNIYPLPIFD